MARASKLGNIETMDTGNTIDALQGHLLFWSMSLLLMLADDVAMLALMFC